MEKGDKVIDTEGRKGEVISIENDIVEYQVCNGIRNITHISNLTNN